MQFGALLAVRNRRVSLLESNPLWGPRRNLAVPLGMVATTLVAVVNLYGPGLQKVFTTTPVPGMFWGIPFAFAVGILAMDEGRKLLVRTYPNVSVQCISVRVYSLTNKIVPCREGSLVDVTNSPNLSLSHCEFLHDL